MRAPTAPRQPGRSGLAPQQVFKTLVAELDGQLMAAVVPVSGQLDLRALAVVIDISVSLYFA